MHLDDMYFIEPAPDEHLVIQGEFFNSFDRYLMVSAEQVVMKKTKLWSHVTGLRSLMLLRAAMTTDSYEDFQILLDQYPEHVIEFGCYGINCGDCPGRNTIIWEVRRY